MGSDTSDSDEPRMVRMRGAAREARHIAPALPLETLQVSRNANWTGSEHLRTFQRFQNIMEKTSLHCFVWYLVCFLVGRPLTLAP